MSSPRKASSPTKDAFKLLFRNPTAVISLLLIVALAAAAITGGTLTGKPPTPDQIESLEEAEILGDTLDMEVNEWAWVEPGKTHLKDKLKPPFSESEEDEGRVYYLGTDHLGRDVAAQLWAGSSISLTIGFLAVGLSVLLGVMLGGIAGFFGRDRVRLPLLVTLLLALTGGIAIPAEATTFGMICFVLAGIAFGYQILVAIAGQRWRPLGGFAVAAAIACIVFGYNIYIENATPEGKQLQHSEEVASVAKDVLLLTRDLGRAQKEFENGIPGAPGEDELWEDQVELEVGYYKMYLAEKRKQNVDYLTRLDKEERLAQEQLDRAEHLESHVDEEFIKSEVDKDDEELAKRHDRQTRWAAQAKDLREKGDRGALQFERIREHIESANEWVEAGLTAMDEAIERADDFDAQSAASRFELMRDLRLALLEAEFRMGVRAVYVTLAMAGAEPEIPDTEEHQKIVDSLNKQAEDLAASTAEAVKTGSNEDAKKSASQDAAIATGAVAAVESVAAAAKAITEVEKRAEELAGIVEADFYQASRDKLAEYVKELRAFVDAGMPVDKREVLKTTADGIDAVIKSGIWKQDEDALKGVAAELREAKDEAVSPQLGDKIERVAKLILATSHNRLEEYDYAIDNRAARDPLVITMEGSNKLLNRRAQMRGDYLKKYEAEASARFDGNSGIVKVRELDGSLRYGVYKWTRHFLVVTAVILLLVITSLLVAGSAQAAADDLRGPLNKVFIPTITVDDLVMRFTEIMMTIPVIFLILVVLALFERDVYIVMGVIGLTSWMGTTRFVRAEILSLREQDFIQAARALGVSDFRIIWRHLVPNSMSPVLVSATLGVASAVLAESTLSFLGIGAGPDQHTWGQILSKGREYIQDAPWLTVVPGIAILITVLSFNLLGEGLREAFNPKLRGR